MQNKSDVTLEQDPRPAEAQPLTVSQGEAAAEGEDEFQLTIRKLDVQVRPRGVLAE